MHSPKTVSSLLGEEETKAIQVILRLGAAQMLEISALARVETKRLRGIIDVLERHKLVKVFQKGNLFEEVVLAKPKLWTLMSVAS